MMTPTEASVEEIAKAVRPVVENQPDVMGLYLFGSQITEETRPESDVDLGVLFDPPGDLRRVVSLEDRLEQALGKPVDLVDMGRSKPFLASRIVAGERIYERDALYCDRFDLYALRRAGDLAHFERERRRLVLEHGAR